MRGYFEEKGDFCLRISGCDLCIPRMEVLEMGAYLNPGNSGFIEMIQSEYVDKTGLIGLINNTINTKKS